MVLNARCDENINTMATSKDLLHVDPNNEFSSLVIKKNKDSNLPVKPPNITKIELSSVLNRAKNFIPMLANANQKLEQDIGEKSASQFDIENVDEDEKFIEMNIGIFPQVDEDSDSSCSSDSDSDNSVEARVFEMLGGITEENIKIPKDTKSTPNLITEIEPELTSNNNKIRTSKKRQKNATKKKGVKGRPNTKGNHIRF